MPRSTDIHVSDHGSIFLLRPLTRAADRWLVDSVQPDAQWFGNALVAEPRFLEALVAGAREAGFEVR